MIIAGIVAVVAVGIGAYLWYSSSKTNQTYQNQNPYAYLQNQQGVYQQGSYNQGNIKQIQPVGQVPVYQVPQKGFGQYTYQPGDTRSNQGVDPELKRLFQAVNDAQANLAAAMQSGNQALIAQAQAVLKKAQAALSDKKITMLHQ